MARRCVRAFLAESDDEDEDDLRRFGGRRGRAVRTDDGDDYRQFGRRPGHAGARRSLPYHESQPGRGYRPNYEYLPAIEPVANDIARRRGPDWPPFRGLGRGFDMPAIPVLQAGDAVVRNLGVGHMRPLADSELAQFVITDMFDVEQGTESATVDCSICLEKFVNGDLRGRVACKHVFHKACIEEWLKTNPTCPQCRANVRQGATGQTT